MMMQKFNKILVVRTDRIGDVVLTTPSLKVLRENYPDAWITLMVTPFTKDLVSANPYIDEIMVDDRKKRHKGFWGFIKLIKDIRKKKFDAAIIFHTKRRSNLFCFFAGVPHRIGYKNNKFGFLLTHPIKDTRHEGKKHETQYCLDVLRSLGIKPIDCELHVSVTKESKEWLQEFLDKNKILNKDFLIGVHPGGSDPSRHWPEYRYRILVDSIIDKYGCKIIFLGGNDTVDVSDRIKRFSKHLESIYDLTGKTNLHQIAQMLGRCNMVISNESGILHVGSAIGAPTVAIFTRNQPGINPERWGPLSKKSKVISVPLQKSIFSFKKAGSAPRQLLELISVDEVLEAVDAIYKLC
ncbi:MAG TPA: lipopolysaccharide heptosyltransferase II [Candidatus Omnitrophota bacterium]|nr:lipopolysaccharide heptosyltransferase II [Candidatus Omnitrophota bacterium]